MSKISKIKYHHDLIRFIDPIGISAVGEFVNPVGLPLRVFL